jgi:hypothetical protein
MSQIQTKGASRVNLKGQRILSKLDAWWELRWQRAQGLEWEILSSNLYSRTFFNPRNTFSLSCRNLFLTQETPLV